MNSTAIPNIPGALILGIAGGSASGKSVLAQEIARALQSQSLPVHCAVIGTDRFFRTDDPDAPHLEFSLYPGERTFDFNQLDSADNEALAAEIKRLALGHPDGSPTVVIVEGVMVCAVKQIRELCDLRVFVELEDDIRLARRVLRDMNSTRRYKQPEEIVRYYLESARIGHTLHVEPSRRFADLIVRGDSQLHRTALLVCGALTALKPAFENHAAED